MSKILIIGAQGQLGTDLCEVLALSHQVIPLGHTQVEITEQDSVEKNIQKYKPQLVINTAAFHKTQECETNPEKAFTVNALGEYYAAAAAAKINATIIYISTNYVFDGKKQIYTEKDTPNPLNIYGASKFAGENLTRIANQKYYIIRTSGLFGIHKSGKGHNFVSLMLEKSRSASPLVVNDEFSSLTYTHDLALKLAELIANNAGYGIYHLTNQGSASWFEFSQKIIEIGKGKFPPLEIKSATGKSILSRPKYSGLKSTNLKRANIKPLRSWTKAVGSYITELNSCDEITRIQKTRR